MIAITTNNSMSVNPRRMVLDLLDYVPNLVDSSTALFDFLLYATLTSFPSGISSSSAAFSIHKSR